MNFQHFLAFPKIVRHFPKCSGIFQSVPTFSKFVWSYIFLYIPIYQGNMLIQYYSSIIPVYSYILGYQGIRAICYSNIIPILFLYIPIQGISKFRRVWLAASWLHLAELFQLLVFLPNPDGPAWFGWPGPRADRHCGLVIRNDGFSRSEGPCLGDFFRPGFQT